MSGARDGAPAPSGQGFGRCPECGAAVPEAGTCRDNLHALLALEWEVPEGAGGIAHFYAVSSYVLQHPDSMSYTRESLAWLRSAVASALAGETSVTDLRAAARRASAATGRITRRDGDPIPGFGRVRWTLTIEDALSGGVESYGERVEAWARAVLSDLDRGGAHAQGEVP